MIDFAALKSPRLVDQAYHRILKLVGDGEIKDGDNMTFSDLSDRLGMSRMPVTVALDRLQREGLVESVPRMGTRLRRIDAHAIWGLIRWRVAIESEVARQANQWMTRTERSRLIDVGRQTDAQMQRQTPAFALLREAHAQGKTGQEMHGLTQEVLKQICDISPGPAGSAADNKFHLLLADLCKANKLREEMHRNIDIFSVKMAICETVAVAAAHRLPPMCPPDHQTLARTIAQGTSQEADQCMRDHIENGFFIHGFLQWYQTNARKDGE